MPKSNIEFVEDLMEYSRHGALSQMFVMMAIEHYAEAVISGKEVVGGFIAEGAWEAVAADVKRELIARRDPKRT